MLQRPPNESKHNSKCHHCNKGGSQLLACGYCNVAMCRKCSEAKLGFKLDLFETPKEKRTQFVTTKEHKELMKKPPAERRVPEGKVYWV